MKKMVKEIIERLIDEDVGTHISAKYELEGRGEAVVPWLLKELEEDQREVVRYWIYDVFGGLKTKATKAVPTLLKSLIEDESERVRAVSAGALGEIVENFKDIVSVLLKAMNKEKSDRVQRTLNMVLNKIAGKLGYASIEELTKVFE
jgi:HEAT repeat protein